VEVEEVAGSPSRSISWNALGLSVRRLRTSLNAWGSVEPDIVVVVGIGRSKGMNATDRQTDIISFFDSVDSDTTSVGRQ
jgi:hypothetical protein